MITAPYNFVPLNEKVFYPSWAKDISHDVPFEDGVSGQINIKITAKSPIFVRDSKNEEEFCNFNGKYFIPGSSVRGMVKSIVEILSFSKFLTQDKKFSYRDLDNPSYKKNAMQQNKIYMGWLYKEDGNWKIDNVGNIKKSKSRIEYTELEEYFGISTVNRIKRAKQAYEKYKIIENFNQLNIPEGTIVFTGSTGNKRTREFLFPNEVINTYILEDNVIETFKNAYYIDTPNENINWKKLWAERFKQNKKIPVFFQLKPNDSNDENLEVKEEILHFGLSMLYKLPYKKSIMNLLKKFVKNYDENKIDMTQAIFGYINKDSALKSRILFSNFKASKVQNNNKKASLALSSPRPTFYHNYLVQNNKNSLITYDDKNAILRGYKFYIPKNEVLYKDKQDNDNTNILTTFKPLDSGSIFEGKLNYFNLKPEELGLILLALTILKDEKHFYKIGMAKPYGFGNCDISIDFKDTDLFVNKYINLIKKELNIDLYQSKQVKTLKKLSQKEANDDLLQYMELEDFAYAKSNNLFLKEPIIEKNKKKTSKDIAKSLSDFFNG